MTKKANQVRALERIIAKLEAYQHTVEDPRRDLEAAKSKLLDFLRALERT